MIGSFYVNSNEENWTGAEGPFNSRDEAIHELSHLFDNLGRDVLYIGQQNPQSPSIG